MIFNITVAEHQEEYLELVLLDQQAVQLLVG